MREGCPSLVEAEIRELARILTSAVSPPSASDFQAPLPWLTGLLQRGLTRIYAVNLGECLDFTHNERLVACVKERTGDPEVARWLERVLSVAAAPSEREAI